MGSLISRLHNAWPAARDDGKTFFGQAGRDLTGQLIILIFFLGPGRAENRDRRPNVAQGLKAFHELRHDFKHPPGVLFFKLIGYVRIGTPARFTKTFSTIDRLFLFASSSHISLFLMK